MKKYFYISFIVMLVASVIGCSKDDPVDPHPPVVEPKEYHFTDLKAELNKIVSESQLGPSMIRLYIICANENLQRMGNEVSVISSSDKQLYIYKMGEGSEQATYSKLSWTGYKEGESRSAVNVVPQVGEFDFVLTTTQPQGYIPGFEAPVIIHESTPPLHLKMWQEGNDWKAELTTKKN